MLLHSAPLLAGYRFQSHRFQAIQEGSAMSQANTFKYAARRYWKDFIPAWLVQILMMADTIRKDVYGTETPIIVVSIIISLLLLSFSWWMRLPLNNKIKQSHATILGMSTPFLVWGCFYLCRLIILKVM